MSGRRLKALKRAFVLEHGRAPLKAHFVGFRSGYESVFEPQNEMRPIKKAYLRGRAA